MSVIVKWNQNPESNLPMNFIARVSAYEVEGTCRRTLPTVLENLTDHD